MSPSPVHSQPTRRIAIAGNPNSGKTTVFNALTGLRQKVGNYPGVTVEKREGRISGSEVGLLDLPGTYSLSARSPDEQIARDIIQGRVEGIPRPDCVLVVIDASNLERNLYLATQIIEFNIPVVIACNMMDVVRSRGLQVDCNTLAARLGVPVVPVAARNNEGIEALKKCLLQPNLRAGRPRHWRLPEPFERAIVDTSVIIRNAALLPNGVESAGALLWLMDYLSGEATHRASADRFLARLPAQPANDMRHCAASLETVVPDAAATAIEARYAWISELAADAAGRLDTSKTRPTMTDRVDAVVTHRIWGMLIFAGVMFTLFLSIFWWAEPLMNLLERGRLALAAVVTGWLHEGSLRSLLTDGVLAGVGAVVGFFPQICILFFFLGLLEDTGYMARAAFLMDRLMNRVGLHGKSFIPLLSSYACAIPGIMATRTIENRADRFTTILIAPLMSCSARLPVYLIVVGVLFPGHTWVKAAVMFGLYALGTVTALLVAIVFKKTILAEARQPFIMELPPYHRPKLWPLCRAMWDRSKLFLTNAGTTIFAVCVVIWALSYFPRLDASELPSPTQAKLAALKATGQVDAADDFLAAERLGHSLIGRLGHFIEPAIAPLGYDWRLGVGILSSFLAREVFVGAVGITFAVGNPDEHAEALRTELAAAKWPDGRPILTKSSGLSLLVFYVLACQCVSTLAVTRKETGSWKWPALMFAYMSILAYFGALATYQIGTRFM